MNKLKKKILENQFLFEELVKRDFKQKYKRTALGMVWSVLSPVLTFIVMALVFGQFFGRNTPHYITYLFCGNIVFSYFREATKGGMSSLMSNSAIISKINLPKYLFVFSKNVSALVNFMLTLAVFFGFCVFDKITFGPHMFMLVYPIVCLIVINLGMGLILSALYVFFRDIQYLYEVFLMLLQYCSAIFYTVDKFSPTMQKVLMINPVYAIIKFMRTIVIGEVIPSPQYFAYIGGYAVILFLIGTLIYKKNNSSFIFYF